MGFELQAYLERIGCDGVPGPSLAALDDVHARHLDRIPFENIDVFLGRPGGLDPESLQARLVRAGRGGYCFEQNTLFATALRALGFAVETLEARVRPPDATAPLPRTHMLLRVEVDGRAYLADVGFGGDGPRLPVPLDGTPREQPDGVYRVGREGGGVCVLRDRHAGAWRDLYAFTLTPALTVDFEVAHHYTATHPESVFVRNLTVQRRGARERHVLRGRRYAVERDGGETAREIADGDLGPLLQGTFGLRLAPDVIRGILSRLP